MSVGRHSTPSGPPNNSSEQDNLVAQTSVSFPGSSARSASAASASAGSRSRSHLTAQRSQQSQQPGTAPTPATGNSGNSAIEKGHPAPASDNVALARRLLAGFLVLSALAALVSVIVLWPRGQAPEVLPGYKETQAAAAESVTGVVTKHETGHCGSPDNGQVFNGAPRPAPAAAAAPAAPAATAAGPAPAPMPVPGPAAPPAPMPEPMPMPMPGGAAAGAAKECGQSVVKLTSGPNEGRNTLLETSGLPGEVELKTGDKIVLSIHKNLGAQPTYAFLDMNRGTALWIWLVAAVVLIVAVAKLRGFSSLIGLGITLLVVGGFLVPGLLLGLNPIALAITTGAVVLFPVIFMVHGRNWKAASALAGTLITLGISALLAHIAIATSSLRGLGDDNNLLIQLYLPNVSVTGLILAGFIIGALGVLNDVTIAQASTVHELYDANPRSTPVQVFKSAMEVGRDHISSMVYTLVLAYLGAALPLTLLLNVADRPLSQILNSDVVATELLRSAIGAMALVLAVPITTAIAAWTIRGRDS